ncbi:alpha/beta fold hydrolase [Xanthomonas cerealis pv. cerealis]|uniref:Alpha/beta fold hydrolase n=1 Tax=Xanthomonas cerealis pv. cerealis TaxID=152263 RepID=A0A514EIE4_9XANT|nr:alpha/beta fold hydrolase [Xanthomonas translucens pv. cerealis]
MHILNFTLVGHSMGGAIAGIQAAEAPQHVRDLVLISTFGLPSRENDFVRAMRAGHNPFLYSDAPGFDRAMAYSFATPKTVSMRVRRALVAANISHAAIVRKTFDALSKPGAHCVTRSAGEFAAACIGAMVQEGRNH